jgi:hypothetical protein
MHGRRATGRRGGRGALLALLLGFTLLALPAIAQAKPKGEPKPSR